MSESVTRSPIELFWPAKNRWTTWRWPTARVGSSPEVEATFQSRWDYSLNLQTFCTQTFSPSIFHASFIIANHSNLGQKVAPPCRQPGQSPFAQAASCRPWTRSPSSPPPPRPARRAGGRWTWAGRAWWRWVPPNKDHLVGQLIRSHPGYHCRHYSYDPEEAGHFPLKCFVKLFCFRFLYHLMWACLPYTKFRVEKHRKNCECRPVSLLIVRY